MIELVYKEVKEVKLEHDDFLWPTVTLPEELKSELECLGENHDHDKCHNYMVQVPICKQVDQIVDITKYDSWAAKLAQKSKKKLAVDTEAFKKAMGRSNYRRNALPPEERKKKSVFNNIQKIIAERQIEYEEHKSSPYGKDETSEIELYPSQLLFNSDGVFKFCGVEVRYSDFIADKGVKLVKILQEKGAEKFAQLILLESKVRKW